MNANPFKNDQSVPKENQRLATVVEKRVGHGPGEMIAGWQSILKALLEKMSGYLRPGAMITFQNLSPQEINFFKRLSKAIEVPHSSVAIFLPPSVRHHMLGGWSGDNQKPGHSDAGVLVASRHEDFDIILNALFAHPPFTPAVDVYDRGQFAAGYQYTTIDECQSEISDLLQRHLT